MAVHVVGRAPVAEAGEYYRVPFDRWRRVLTAVRAQHDGLVDEAVLDDMVFNNGAGVLEDATCVELAARLAAVFTSSRWPAFADEVLSGDRALETLAEVAASGPPAAPGAAERAALDEDMERWINFLENCGGFAVW